MAVDSVARSMAMTAMSSGGGSAPSEYLKNASVSGNTLTLTNKDDTTVEFTPSGDNIFWATYGTTTGTELLTAYNAGKAIFVKVRFFGTDAILRMVNYNSEDSPDSYEFTGIFRNYAITCSYIDDFGQGWGTVAYKQIPSALTAGTNINIDNNSISVASTPTFIKATIGSLDTISGGTAIHSTDGKVYVGNSSNWLRLDASTIPVISVSGGEYKNIATENYVDSHHDSSKQDVLDSTGANANVIAPLYVDTGELRIELGNGVRKLDDALEVKPGTGILVNASGVNVDTDVIQEKLTAGTNITIDNNVISASVSIPSITVDLSQIISQSPLTIQFTSAQAAIMNSANAFILNASALGYPSDLVFQKGQTTSASKIIFYNINENTVNSISYTNSNMQGVYEEIGLQKYLTSPLSSSSSAGTYYLTATSDGSGNITYAWSTIENLNTESF